MRVVFDTNILISAAISEGAPARCVELARSGKVTSVTCAQILEEYAKVLIEKIDLTQAEAAVLARSITRYSEVVAIGGDLQAVPDDPIDDKIVECAVAGNATHIVSGNQHLLNLKNYQKIAIVPAAEFMKLAEA